MLCPKCGHDKTRVIETRPDEKDLVTINRVRKCQKCGVVWTTEEKPGEIYNIIQQSIPI